ncbi:hypothetical protein BDY24DRAFT_378239 [Mrakia frigida]|uniref:uncharacterized protein n=1 Tax=Mrakia frigida TaxID=29902 RepID=UPI003FCC1971
MSIGPASCLRPSLKGLGNISTASKALKSARVSSCSQTRQVYNSPSHQHPTPSGFSTRLRSCHRSSSSSSSSFISLRSSSSSSLPPSPISLETSTSSITPVTNIPLNGVIFYEGSASTPYELKHETGGHYTCTCSSFTYQNVTLPKRTCKHLKEVLGESFEWERTGGWPEKGTKLKKEKVVKTKKVTKPSTDASPSTLDDALPLPTRTPPKLLLAQSYKFDGSGPDPTGYWMSEKLDGIRGYWDGKTLVSRIGNVFPAPDWFLNKFPKDLDLDGEIYLGRGAFSEASSIVRSYNSPRWNELTYKAFDIPSSTRPFEERLALLHERFGAPTGSLFGGGENSYYGKLEGRRDSVIEVLEHVRCEGREHVAEMLEETQRVEGEGLMLRKPKSLYKRTRSTDLLKVKTFFDAEALLISYVDGKGKYTGITGSLKCEMACGSTFSVGSGMTDVDRKNPPPIGSLISYRFFELSKTGIPRFPTFVGIAVDKTGPKDAEVPVHRIASAEGKEI